MTVTPPTFVAKYEPAWDAAQETLTTSVTTAVGDVLVYAGLGSNTNGNPGVPTGGTGLTWTEQQTVSVSTSWCVAKVYTATAATAETFTMSVTATGSGAHWGFTVYRFSGVDSIGASAKTNASGSPSLSLTTTADDSTVAVFAADWNAVDGSTRTWLTGAGSLTEETYATVSGAYTVYGGHYADAGTAGSKTVGLSAPTGQKYSIVAVELLGVEEEEPPPEQVGVIKTWDGAGLSSGTMSTSSAGTDDETFSSVNGTWSIVSGDPTTVTASPVSNRTLVWSGLSVTELATRHYWSTTALPESECVIMRFLTASAQSFRLQVRPNGLALVRDSSGNRGQSATGAVEANTEYRIEVVFPVATDPTVTFYKGEETTPAFTIEAAAGTWTTPDAVWFGSDGADGAKGGDYTMRNFAVSDTAEAVGAWGTPPPPITSPFFHIVGGELKPMTATML